VVVTFKRLRAYVAIIDGRPVNVAEYGRPPWWLRPM
jgi:hypothetical protein